MQNESKAKSSPSSNKKIIIGLILIMLLLIITAVTGFNSFYKSNNKAIRYFHTLKDIKDIKSMYQEQIVIWRTMAAYKGDDQVLRDAYYKFSKKSDIIQDKFFNLRMKYIDENDNHTAEKIEKIKLFHQKASEKNISVIFETSAAFMPYDQAVLMREDEAKLFDELDFISKEIISLVGTEIGKTTNYYYFMLGIFFLVMIILCAILTMIMISRKRING